MSLLFIISMYAEVTSYHPYELKLSSSQTINLQRSGKILEKNFPPCPDPPSGSEVSTSSSQGFPVAEVWCRWIRTPFCTEDQSR